jgi:hypothetical protein
MVGTVKGEMRSDCLLDLAAAEATGADADASGRSIDHCADTLKVGIEGALRLVIGMTDVMARLMLLRADVTCESHGILLRDN